MTTLKPTGVYSPFDEDTTTPATLEERLLDLQDEYGVDGDTALQIAWEQAPIGPAA